MPKARPTVSPTATEKHPDLALRGLLDELRDRLSEASALFGAVSAVAGLTSITVEGVARLRHVVISAEGALRDVERVADELRKAVRS